MTDKRELINLRLIAIFGSVDGMTPAKVYRDRGEFDEKKTIPPIMIYLDGTERKVLDANSGRRDNARGGVPAVVPMLMEMSPPSWTSAIARPSSYRRSSRRSTISHPDAG
jgi:hypothetical protein